MGELFQLRCPQVFGESGSGAFGVAFGWAIAHPGAALARMNHSDAPLFTPRLCVHRHVMPLIAQVDPPVYSVVAECLQVSTNRKQEID